MSTNQATFSDSFDFNLLARGLAVGASRVIKYVGIQPPFEAAETASVNVPDETERWLASIVGAFDEDPFYARMIDNIEENRRRMAAEYDAAE